MIERVIIEKLREFTVSRIIHLINKWLEVIHLADIGQFQMDFDFAWEENEESSVVRKPIQKLV